MGYSTANGETLADLAVTIPRTGAPFCDGMVPGSLPELPTTQLGTTIIMGDLQMACTVSRQFSFNGDNKFRAIWGGGAWGSHVGPKGYSNNAGLQFAQIAGDAAREVGETLSAPGSYDIGAHYARKSEAAAQVFSLLPSDVHWWVDSSGVTNVGTRESAPIGAPYDLMDLSGERGSALIATDEPAAFMPGKILPLPTGGSFVIDAVSWIATPSEIRGRLWLEM